MRLSIVYYFAIQVEPNGIDGDLHDLAKFKNLWIKQFFCKPKFAKALLTRYALFDAHSYTLVVLEYFPFLFQLNQFVTAEMLR